MSGSEERERRTKATIERTGIAEMLLEDQVKDGHEQKGGEHVRVSQSEPSSLHPAARAAA